MMGALFGGTPEELPEEYRLASPVTYIGRHCPPTLLLQGADDFIVSAEAVQRMADELRQVGVPVVYVEYPQTDHAFDLILPQISPPAQAALYETERFLAHLSATVPKNGRSSSPTAPLLKNVKNHRKENVMVLVRKNQLPDVLPRMAVNRPSPSFLFMVNNASGPEPLIQAVGRERVLLGFAGAGGTREGHAVTTIILSGESQPTTIGELDGQTTPRLETIADVLRGVGFPTAIEAHMDACCWKPRRTPRWD
jgi:hypothetical protein